jgi:hypothetical protein
MRYPAAGTVSLVLLLFGYLALLAGLSVVVVGAVLLGSAESSVDAGTATLFIAWGLGGALLGAVLFWAAGFALRLLIDIEQRLTELRELLERV